MSRFPRLREIVERTISAHVRKREQLCKDQVSNYIECQLAYMNTNHEDFIGFANAENQSTRTPPARDPKPGNQTIRKGYLTLQNLSIIKDRTFWFLLTAENLAWYKDDTEKEIHYILPLNGLKMRDLDPQGGGFMAKKPSFAVFLPNGSNVYKDFKQLELRGASSEDVDAWKASLLRAGVYPARGEAGGEGGEVDPQLKRQVETIRNLVESYMAIVTKTTKDLVPKIIANLVVKHAERFVFEELLVRVYAGEDQMNLLEESPEEMKRREEKMSMYQACKSALDIIGSCSMDISTNISSRNGSNICGGKSTAVSVTTTTKKGYRLSTPPPSVNRPAPPPPAGVRRFKSERNLTSPKSNKLLPRFYVLTIP